MEPEALMGLYERVQGLPLDEPWRARFVSDPRTAALCSFAEEVLTIAAARAKAAPPSRRLTLDGWLAQAELVNGRVVGGSGTPASKPKSPKRKPTAAQKKAKEREQLDRYWNRTSNPGSGRGRWAPGGGSPPPSGKPAKRDY